MKKNQVTKKFHAKVTALKNIISKKKKLKIISPYSVQNQSKWKL